MSGLLTRARSFWHALRRPTQLEAEMDDEMRFHIEMEAERLGRESDLDPEEALRRAAIAFGGVEKRKEEGREIRGLARVSNLSLDLKLGLRMMVKYPMLTLVGGIAIAVATAVGVGASEFVRDLLIPELPLEDGDRIVRLYQVDTQGGGRVPVSLYDLEVWRESVSSLQELGAYATLEQGLVSDRGEVGTVSLARISASAFGLTRVPPLLGRFLHEADERPEAPPVVVLGYTAWQTVLGGDPDPIGRTVQLGGTPTTVVGIMPKGYGFPVMQNAWVPFRVDPAGLRPETAPRASSFARLAPGATLESARAELEVAGRRTAADFPEIYGPLSPGLDEFARRGSDTLQVLALTGARLLLILLLVVVCANVATLVFARTVTRESEIAVRTALGATRGRIVLQLFAEALVLVGGAALIGMSVAWLALGRISRLFFTIQQSPQPPFWWNDALSPATVAYTGVLVVVGALMIGVVPALRATRGAVRPRLGRLSAGEGGGLRFGGMWTVVIVLQVALSVAFLPLAVSRAGNTTCAGLLKSCGLTAFDDAAAADFPADEYVTAQLGRDPVVPPRTPEEHAEFLEASRRLFEEVRDRLAADPSVRGVAFASGLSAMNHVISPFEFVGDGSSPPVTATARILLVDRSYLDLMNATLVAGESLESADSGPESRSVVVNEAFVNRILGGRNPVGGQLRFPERGGESSLVEVPAVGTSVEIVGIVRNPQIDAFGPGSHPVIYAPLDLAPVSPRAAGLVGMPQAPATQLFVRFRPEAGATASHLYGIVAAVDPTLRLSELGSAADAWGPVHRGARLSGWIFMTVAAIVLMLSVAGVYALMSFTVSRRTREIAIRTAVGAPRGRILRSVFGRAALQLLAGVALGGLIAVPVLWNGMVDEGPRSLVIVSTLLLGAGLAACLMPVRKALTVEPAVAMKSD